MKRNRSCSLLATTAGFLVAAPAFAADHREAPIIQEDPAADIADVYAFRSPEDSSKLVLVMTVNPFSVPTDAPSYHFSPNVRYRFNIDNSGDAQPDYVVDVRFSPTVPGPQALTATFSDGTVIEGQATSPTKEPTPEQPIVLQGPAESGIRVFAGPRDDPFFFDLVGFQRLMAGTGGFTGVDAFAGLNVSAIVVEIPLATLAGSSTNLQIWGETDRNLFTIRDTVDTQVQFHGGNFVQIERMGNPTVNTLLIPPDMKDLFNVGKPADDPADFAGTIVNSLSALGTAQDNINTLASVAVPDTLKLNLNAPDGFPNGRRLEDDVIDTLLFFVFNQVDTPDGVDANDAAFLGTFPFLAPPRQAP